MTNIYEVTVEQIITRSFEVQADDESEARAIALDEHEDHGVDDERSSIAAIECIDEEDEDVELCDDCNEPDDECICVYCDDCDQLHEECECKEDEEGKSE